MQKAAARGRVAPHRQIAGRKFDARVERGIIERRPFRHVSNTRVAILAAAAFVKVTQTIFDGSSPRSSRLITRCTSTCLPHLALADTNTERSGSAAAIWRQKKKKKKKKKQLGGGGGGSARSAAADPERSVFVSANAGSGKTHVLVQRVINLLLRGEDPSKNLCVTFTKAAAANMATRVFDTLAEWTALDDTALDARIKLATGNLPDAAQRARARRLFANALETPGGLKVQTIHAFCTRLLHQFPFEADVAARFEVLDEATTAQLLNQLTLEVLLKGATETQSALGKALDTAITAAADVTFKEVIAETIAKRDLITKWTARAGGVQQAIDEMILHF